MLAWLPPFCRWRWAQHLWHCALLRQAPTPWTAPLPALTSVGGGSHHQNCRQASAYVDQRDLITCCHHFAAEDDPITCSRRPSRISPGMNGAMCLLVTN